MALQSPAFEFYLEQRAALDYTRRWVLGHFELLLMPGLSRHFPRDFELVCKQMKRAIATLLYDSSTLSDGTRPASRAAMKCA